MKPCVLRPDDDISAFFLFLKVVTNSIFLFEKICKLHTILEFK